MNFHQRRDRAHAAKRRETKRRKTNAILKHFYTPVLRELVDQRSCLIFIPDRNCLRGYCYPVPLAFEVES